MSLRLRFLDWLFTRQLGAFEFWTGCYSMVMGFAFIKGESSIQIVANQLEVTMFDWDIGIFGHILLIGGFTQIFALVIVSRHDITSSRILRWLGSVSEGSVWALCATFAWLTDSPIHGFRFLYTLLFLQELWVVMSIAYRGFRGKCNS